MPTAPHHVSVTLPVQWSDMDALGHVNNARFFTWFESARIALFQRIGVPTSGPSSTGPILATTSCDFLRPVVFPATVRIGARVTRVGETSLTMEYEVADASDAAALYARGTSVAVLVDYATTQKVRIPDDIRAAIAALS
ncbi:MAG: 4-hydroxybenzoyl-CoA thioesterase [Labilithrix sp.]|nr:4-hydroxybenzoyl-CoA thioesterase [Labilithrix sp.]